MSCLWWCREWAQGLVVDLIPQPDVPARQNLLQKAARYLHSRGKLPSYVQNGRPADKQAVAVGLQMVL